MIRGNNGSDGLRFIFLESCASYTHALALALGRYSSPRRRLPFSGMVRPPPSSITSECLTECRFSFADHHVACNHVGRFAWRAGAELTGGRQASTPDGENTPSRLRVNDLRAESRLGVA